MKKLLVFFSFILLITSCNFSVYTGTFGNTNPPQIGGNSSGADIVLGKTTGLRGSEGLYTDNIRISWDPTPNADIYHVQKINFSSPIKPSIKNIDESLWQKVGTTSNPFFEDSAALGTDKNTYYAYRVCAESLVTGEINEWSTPTLGAYLNSPSDLTVSKGESETVISIQFTQTPGSTSYEIYKNTENSFGDTLTPIKVLTHFQDKTIGEYEYNVADNEKGVSLYFSIKACSSDTVTKAAFSSSRVGYTYVPGAPQSPIVSTNSGESTSSITISFPKNEEYDYIIMKSRNGSVESELLSTLNGDTLEDDGNGNFFYEDTDVIQNTTYNYSVTAVNEYGKSQASNVSAYLLSPPVSVALEPVNNASQFGYQLSIEAPNGWEDNELWQYVVTTTSEDGTVTEREYAHDEALAFYPAAKSSSDAGYSQEPREVSVYVKHSGNNATTNPTGTKIYGIPTIPASVNFRGTKNVWDSSIGANEKGVYPVVLRWNSIYDAAQYRIKRNDGREYVTQEVRLNDANVELGKKYNYEFFAEDALGRYNSSKSIEGCYGAITHTLFSAEFERHCTKPWEYQEYHPEYAHTGSKGGIWSYIRNEGTGSLGSASNNDSYINTPRSDGRKGGTVSYNAKVSGLGGYLTFEYTNGFGESDYIYFWRDDKATQGYNSQVSMSGDGNFVPYSNSFYLSGWYGDNRIDATGIKTVSKKLAGIFKVYITYNTLDGGKITKEGTTSPIPRGKVS